MSEFGDKWADRLTGAMGSWRFIICQAFVMICWAIFNTLYLFNPLWFDPYPFIFMNLAMSAQAAFTAPIIMMSSNRAAASDRSALLKDVKLDEESLEIIKRIEEKLNEACNPKSAGLASYSICLLADCKWCKDSLRGDSGPHN